MANISDADVTIECVGAVKQLVEYLQLCEEDAYYGIVDADATEEARINSVGEDKIVIRGYAQGRWGYSTNITNYFAPLRSTSHWRDTKEKQIAYGKLLSALKRNRSAYVEIHYTDIETGVGFHEEGLFTLNYATVSKEAWIDATSEDLSISLLMEKQGMDVYEAIDTMYGDEVTDAFSSYEQAGGKLPAEVYIEGYADEIYAGTHDPEEVAEREAQKIEQA